MNPLHITSLGISTPRFPSAHALAQHLNLSCNFPQPPSIPDSLLRGADPLTTLALRALHQAASSLTPQASPHTALLLHTGFGTVESTVAYLESMLADAGQFASPRHFTRSVHSSVASLAAISLKIHGPCETLAFDQFPITSAFDRAALLIQTHRADSVLLCFADEPSPLIPKLAAIATQKLHRKQYLPHTHGPDGGAVAFLLSRHPPGIAALHMQPSSTPHVQNSAPHSLMDSALSLAATILDSAHSRTSLPWTEQNHPPRSQPLKTIVIAPNHD